MTIVVLQVNEQIGAAARKILADVQVDQSGKIEDMAVDTVLAFSNGISRAIRIPSPVKQAGLTFIRQRHLSRKTQYIRLLAAGLYCLLYDHLDQLAYVTIDVEFAGREEDVRGMLLTLIWKNHPQFSKDQLVLRRVGKKSPALHLALTTFQRKRSADKTITEKEFIAALK